MFKNTVEYVVTVVISYDKTVIVMNAVLRFHSHDKTSHMPKQNMNPICDVLISC